MSRDSAAKKARRKKRQAARAVHRVPDEIVQDMAAVEDGVVADLAEFDERITQRGWEFDEEQSNDDYAVWFFEPSGAEVDDGLPVTSLWLDAAEDGAIVRVVFVGTVERYEFTHDELFEHLDAIEAYRVGGAQPEFS
ncbi:hypothetical protein [Mycolicibacterium sp. XJ870]